MEPRRHAADRRPTGGAAAARPGRHGIGRVRLPDGRRGALLEGEVTPAPRGRVGGAGAAPERWALAHFEGAPYQWGGVTPWGVDCSGLVQTTFAARGTIAPARLGAPGRLRQRSWTSMPSRPGDLLFFRGESGDRITHVAFAAAEDALIHSTVACGGVLVESWLPGTRAGPLRDTAGGGSTAGGPVTQAGSRGWSSSTSTAPCSSPLARAAARSSRR